MRHPLRHLLLAAGLGGLAFLATACGGGGGGSGGGGTAGLGILLTDAPTDGLAVVEVDLTSIQLRHSGGGFTGNLLPARRTYDVLGLAGTRSLLALVDPPAGDYDAVRVAVDPASIRIYAAGGAAVPVRVLRSNDVATFSTRGEGDLTLGSGFRDLLVDVDLAKSLGDDPLNPGGKTFELEVEAEHEFEDEGMDEFRGRVTGEDPTAGSFTITLLDDSGVSFGSATVLVDAGDALVDDDGAPFASLAAFFAALQTGSEVEVHGSLTAAGRIAATRVEIEDAFSFPIKLKGDVLSVDSGAQEFEFLLKEVRRGSQTVYSVLGNLGNPRVLTVSWDAGTAFTVEDGGAATSGALTPGAEVYVSFSSLTPAMPFPADLVEFDDEGASFEGTLTGAGGLPGSFTFTLDDGEPAVLSGAVTGPVTVTLAGVGRIYLDVETEPSLQPGELLAGLRLEVHGALSGPPGGATIAASRVKVEPGKMKGSVLAIQGGSRTVSVQVDEWDDPFGGPLPGAGTSVHVPSGAWIEGESGPIDFAGLEALFAGLGVGESLELTVRGIGDGGSGIEGWELEARVRD